MRINKINTNMNGVWFKHGNFAGMENEQKEEIIPEENRIGEEKEKTFKEKQDFRALCKKFPDISFVVVNKIGEPQPEYSGICNTSVFGELGKVSIEVDKEVIENLDDDWDNIVTMIQAISDNYGSVAGHAKASSGCKYTAVTLHYASVGNLSFTQSLWFNPPFVLRDSGEKTGAEDVPDTNRKYLQVFLMNIQNDVFDKLFEIGENKQGNKIKSIQKYVKEYQRHFVYQKAEVPGSI